MGQEPLKGLKRLLSRPDQPGEEDETQQNKTAIKGHYQFEKEERGCGHVNLQGPPE